MNSKNAALPGPDWNENIDQLCLLFKQKADAIMNKLPAQDPRVNDSKVPNAPLRVKENVHSMPLDLVDKVESPELQLSESQPINETTNIAKACEHIITKQVPALHRHNTRSKVAVAAQQLEAKQLE